MSLIPHTFSPRSLFNMDNWMQPFGSFSNWPMTTGVPTSTLDLFDPFDELDTAIARNLQWLNRPEWLGTMPTLPRVPQKYRITLDCTGYNPNSIKTEVINNQVFVTGREESKFENDYSVKEFKKTYNLPETAESNQLVSFMTGDGQLVIEVPLRETRISPNLDLMPRIVDAPEGGGKLVQMQFSIPEGIRPEKVHVNIKDRCLIVKAEDTLRKSDGVSKFHYYKKTTLPENTDFDALRCNYDNHLVSIQAPILTDFNRLQRIQDHRTHPVKMMTGVPIGQQQASITSGTR